MEIKYIRMEGSTLEFTEKGNYDLFVAHTTINVAVRGKKHLRKAEKLEKLSAKNLLAVGYSSEYGYDFLYEVEEDYIHILVQESSITFLYILHSGNIYHRTFEVTDYSPKYWTEEGPLGYFKQEVGVNFLARDGQFYAADFATVEANSLKG